MTEPEQNWRSKWDEECPLTIGVALQNWEQWSDAVLRDELMRIRDIGFTAVRVRFDRDNDIEKMAGMLNWRNPDRFFDAAQKAGLQVIAAPGNRPYRDPKDQNPYEPFSDAEIANISAWLNKFCGQYKEHPALLAWSKDNYPDWVDLDWRISFDYHIVETRRELLLAAYHAADPNHPVIDSTVNLLQYRPFKDDPRLAPSQEWVGAPVCLDDDLRVYQNDERVMPSEFDRLLYITARITVDQPAPSLPLISRCTSGTSRSYPPFTMTAGKMTRMLLLFLASGIKGVLFDRWLSARNLDEITLPGLPGNPSGMVDWLGRVTPHAQAAGTIAQATERFRHELWRSQALPQVHVLYTGFTDSVSRIGVARVLINANVPFAFLTDYQLLHQTVMPAPIIFLPATDQISDALLTKLREFAETGGRIIADVPCGIITENAELRDSRPGSPFEQLFGVSIAGVFYTDPPNLKDVPTPAQLRTQIVTTTARAGGGAGEVPAFTENRVGKGRALLINLPLSQINASENLPNAQLSLLSYILGNRQTELPGLTGCLQFRRHSQNAEHVFLINDSAEERTASVTVPTSFTNVMDVLADTALAIMEGNVSVKVPAGSGSWLRLNTSD